MGLHSGIANTQNNNPNGVQPELAAFLVWSGVTLDADHIQYINGLIAALKAAGVWQVLDALYLLNQPTFGAIPYNLVKPSFNLTIPQGDKGFSAGYGLKGDGSSIYANTNCTLSTDPKYYKSNSASMFMWCLTDISSATYDMAATSNSNTYIGAIRSRNGNSANLFTNSGSTAMPIQTGAGFSAWSRVDASNIIGYKSGNDYQYVSNQTGVPASKLCLLRFGPTGATYSSSQLALAGFGGALTVDQLDAAYVAFLNYLIQCGTITNDNPPTPEVLLPGCFTPTTVNTIKAINGTNFRVYQQVPPPTSNAITESTYVNFPATDCASQQVDSFQSSVSTQNTIRCQHFLWQMRAVVTSPLYNNRPNPTPPGVVGGVVYIGISRNDPTVPTSPVLGCRLQYSTVDKANAATEAMMRYSLGYDGHTGSSDPLLMGYLDVANAAGIPDSAVSSWQDANTNSNTFFPSVYSSKLGTYYVCQDYIVLPDSKLSTAPMGAGIVLDSEAQDGRTPDQLLAQIQMLASVCAYKGKEFVVYPNALNQNGAVNTGFTIDNIYKIAQTPNVVLSILASNDNIYKDIQKSIDAQITLLKGPLGDQPIYWSNLIMSCGIGVSTNTLTTDQCKIIRSYVINDTHTMKGVEVFKDYGQAGGAPSRPYNQALATVLGLPLFTGSISGTNLTVTAVTSGAIQTGYKVIGTYTTPTTPPVSVSVASGTTIVSQTSGTPGGVGVYVVSVSQTVGSTIMLAQS
jgi:hypothetical protein